MERQQIQSCELLCDTCIWDDPITHCCGADDFCCGGDLYENQQSLFVNYEEEEERHDQR